MELLLLLLYTFTFLNGADEWTVFMSDEIPCVMACVVPAYHFMYLDIDCLNVVDPFGQSLFQHELRHVKDPSWVHYYWELGEEVSHRCTNESTIS